MKTIIAGSRSISDHRRVYLEIEKSGIHITEVVCGGARGVDSIGRFWAEQNDIPVKFFFPDWDKHGRGAGILRNELMAKYAEAAIIVRTKHSRGSMDMAWRARNHDLKVYEVIV